MVTKYHTYLISDQYQMSVGNKIPSIFNKTSNFHLQVCLNISNLLLSLRIKELTLFRLGLGENGFCFRFKFLWLFVKFICSTFGENIVKTLGPRLNLRTFSPAKIDNVFFLIDTFGQNYFTEMRAYNTHQSIEH